MERGSTTWLHLRAPETNPWILALSIALIMAFDYSSSPLFVSSLALLSSCNHASSSRNQPTRPLIYAKSVSIICCMTSSFRAYQTFLASLKRLCPSLSSNLQTNGVYFMPRIFSILLYFSPKFTPTPGIEASKISSKPSNAFSRTNLIVINMIMSLPSKTSLQATKQPHQQVCGG